MQFFYLQGWVQSVALVEIKMKLHWEIAPKDVERVHSFLQSHEEDTFVQSRRAKNLQKDKPAITKDDFWYWMVVCLLTTQQRSGPTSAVTRFANKQPFPLAYSECLRQGDLLNSFVWHEITDFGGLRFSGRISGELVANLHYLESNNGWYRTMAILDKLRLNQTVECEREAADYIDDKFDGFGPKQSRNLLQCLGLTKYEIPIDSRITDWLNDFGFPVRLSAAALADHNYYNFVLEGFQQLCEQCRVYPCELDAAIFASFDKGGWTEEIIV